MVHTRGHALLCPALDGRTDACIVASVCTCGGTHPLTHPREASPHLLLPFPDIMTGRPDHDPAGAGAAAAWTGFERLLQVRNE